MGEPDCGVCEAMGYRSCDLCGAIIFDPVDQADEELCDACTTRLE